jgi:hypothetical protein
MTPAKGDVAHVERLLAEAGQSKLTVTGGSSSIVVSSADETGVMRERFRLVAIPNHKYRAEIAEAGRWKNSGLSGLLEKVVPDVLRTKNVKL